MQHLDQVCRVGSVWHSSTGAHVWSGGICVEQLYWRTCLSGGICLAQLYMRTCLVRWDLCGTALLANMFGQVGSVWHSPTGAHVCEVGSVWHSSTGAHVWSGGICGAHMFVRWDLHGRALLAHMFGQVGSVLYRFSTTHTPTIGSRMIKNIY